jgi:ParB/RepB/Spo0J family partition protein
MATLMEIPLDKLAVSPLNVRRELGDLTELVASITAEGVIEPVLVRPAGEKYEVVAGVRRYTASKEVGLSAIPAVVQEMSDAEAVVRSLVENLQRGDLNLEERVGAYHNLQNLDKERCGTLRGLAKVIGKNQPAISQDFEAYRALQTLRPHGMQVITRLSPDALQRQQGDALPERHAGMLEQAISAVGDTLPSDHRDRKYVELARAIAPLERERAAKLLEEFKKYPEKPLAELQQRAFAVQRVDWELPAPVIRRIEEMAERSGGGGVENYISQLVDRQEPAPGVAGTQLTFEETSRSTGESASAEPPAAPSEAPKYQPVGLPEDSPAMQLARKLMWNLEHYRVKADFYTIGYSGRDIDQFLDLLRASGVKTLVDVRADPVSPYKPEFSKENLARSLAAGGMRYVHRPELGVPREIRSDAAAKGDREEVFRWYDANVIPRFSDGLYRELERDFPSPMAFMCMEVDPTACHRHRLFLALERAGKRGYDL